MRNGFQNIKYLLEKPFLVQRLICELIKEILYQDENQERLRDGEKDWPGDEVERSLEMRKGRNQIWIERERGGKA